MKMLILAATPLLLHGQAANTSPDRSSIKNSAAAAPVVKYKGSGGAACIGAQVDEIAHGLASGRRMWKPLATVKTVSLVGNDGALKCEQNDGTPCTEEQVQALGELAGPDQVQHQLQRV